MIGIFNLWLPFALGYSLVWLVTSLINRNIKREVPGEHTNEYKSKKLMYLFGFYPFIALFIASIFVPIQTSTLFWVGLSIFVFGTTLNIITINTFVRSGKGLQTSGIYRYSRNPMYATNMLFILGLNLMGWAQSFANLIFILVSLFWIGGTHWCVLQEEAFLAQKFGQTYLDYKKRAPRYWFIF
ncbi:methyltransferase family protein [Candidatus Margulisiibacteriota bacterium]